jgi:hypothetical protein
MTNTLVFIVAVVLGGLLIAGIGSAQTMYVQEEPIQSKGVIRDFCIGSVLTALLYQLIPESFQNFTDSLMSISVPKLPSIGGALPNLASSAKDGDFELQMGVPRF